MSLWHKERPVDHRNPEFEEVQINLEKGFIVCSPELWVGVKNCLGALWTVREHVCMIPCVGCSCEVLRGLTHPQGAAGIIHL